MTLWPFKNTGGNSDAQLLRLILFCRKLHLNTASKISDAEVLQSFKDAESGRRS